MLPSKSIDWFLYDGWETLVVNGLIYIAQINYGNLAGALCHFINSSYDR